MNLSEPMMVEDMTNECYHRRVCGMVGSVRWPMPAGPKPSVKESKNEA